MKYLEGNNNYDKRVSDSEIIIDKERNKDETNKDISNRNYTNNESKVADPVITTRSGRIVNKPKHLDMYET